MVGFFENSASRLDPLCFGLQSFWFNQWLRSATSKHFPVTCRFPSRKIDRIGAQILHAEGVVLFRGDVCWSRIESGYRRRPLRECGFVPGLGDVWR